MTDQIDLVHARDELEHQLATARLHERRIADLEAQYGTGVRPGWVGEEIAIEGAAADRHLQAAELARKRVDAIEGRLTSKQ